MTLRALLRHAIDGFVWRWRLDRMTRKTPAQIAELRDRLAKARKAHRPVKHIEAAMKRARIEQMRGAR